MILSVKELQPHAGANDQPRVGGGDAAVKVHVARDDPGGGSRAGRQRAQQDAQRQRT